MKIKAVCELTGLTDRTIRYYIEEKLISPLYTENYLGRKTYNFSEKDIKDLNHIAVLRKFDFTLEEIKSVWSTEPEEITVAGSLLRTSGFRRKPTGRQLKDELLCAYTQWSGLSESEV